MADIELVIKLSEEDYTEICKCTYPNDILVGELVHQVRNGTPIPKNHGRLIDADKLKTHFIGTEQGTDLEVYLEPTIIDAPTIIEADKGE